MSSSPDRLGAFASFVALLALASAALLAPAPARAAASFDACTGTIDAVPFTINSPGTWCLKQAFDLNINSGNAITVAADNVTVACNGFRLHTDPGGAFNNSNGVFAQDRKHTTVRDCWLDGFNIGVFITGQRATSREALVENNLIDHSTQASIQVNADFSVVRGNRTYNIGGGNNGIYSLQGDYTVDIIDNTVDGVVSLQGDAVGIWMGSQSNRSSIIGNRVRDLNAGINGGRIGISSYNSTTEGTTIRGNDVSYAGSTFATDRGIYCNSPKSGARDNQVNGLPIGLSGCRDDGGNVSVP